MIEHFGLGRYGDTIDVEGHNKGIRNLINMLSKNGSLYLSFPIGKYDLVLFNANRIFQVDTILHHPSIKKYMQLLYLIDYVAHGLQFLVYTSNTRGNWPKLLTTHAHSQVGRG